MRILLGYLKQHRLLVLLALLLGAVNQVSEGGAAGGREDSSDEG